MATRVGEAYYELTAKNAKLKAKLRESDKVTVSWTEKMSGVMRKYGKVAFAGAVAGVGALTAMMVKATQMAAKEEIQTAQLAHQIGRLGIDSEAAMRQVDALANSQQSLTRFGDTDTRRMLAAMIMLTNDYEGSMKNLSLAQDMAESGMFDQRSAARYLGMAMQGNIEMLGRYIPELKTSVNASLAQMSASEKAAFAIKLLEEKFGGLAKQMGTTTAGAWAKLMNTASDAMEAMGAGMLAETSSGLNDITQMLKDMKPQLKNIGKGFARIFSEGIKFADRFSQVIEAAALQARKLFRPAEDAAIRAAKEMKAAADARTEQNKRILEALTAEERAETKKLEMQERARKEFKDYMKEKERIAEKYHIRRLKALGLNVELQEMQAAHKKEIEALKGNHKEIEQLRRVHELEIGKIMREFQKRNRKIAKERAGREKDRIEKEIEQNQSMYNDIERLRVDFLRSTGQHRKADLQELDAQFDKMAKKYKGNAAVLNLIEATRAAKRREIMNEEREVAKETAREIKEAFKPELVGAAELGRRALLAGFGAERKGFELPGVAEYTHTGVSVGANEDKKHTTQFAEMIGELKRISAADLGGLEP